MKASPAKLAAGLALLIVIAWTLRPGAQDAARTLPLLRHVRADWLAGALLCQLGVYAALANVLAAPLRAFDKRVPFGDLWFASVVFLLANRALPGPAVAGLASLTVVLGRRGVASAQAQAVAATFYAADYVSFFALAALALGGLTRGGHLAALHPSRLAWAGGLVAAAALAAVVLLRAPSTTARLAAGAAHRLGRLTRRADPDTWATRAQEAVTGFFARWQAIAARPATLASACVWAGLMHVFEAATLVCIARAFHCTLAPSVAAAGYVAANLAAIVSFLPGGAGLYEGVMLAAFHALAGLPLPAALAVVLTYRLLSFWLPIPLALGALRSAKRGAQK